MATQSPQLSALRPRWREHELILATVICVLSIAGEVWRILRTPWSELNSAYERPFVENNIPFSYLSNVFLPGVCVAVLLYLCFLQMNFFILPRLLQTDAPVKGNFTFHFSRQGGIDMKGAEGAVLKRTIWGIVYTLLLIVFLGAGWGLADYYRHAYAYFIPGNRDDSRQIILGVGLKKAFTWTVIYLLYASLREAAIVRLTASSQWKAFRIRLSNQVTGYFAAYFILFFYFRSFDIIDDKVYGVLFSWPPSVVLNYLSNVFWLFPFKGKRSIFKGDVFRRLLLSTLLWAVPFAIGLAIAVDEAKIFMPFLISGWLVLLIVVTPLSYWIYVRRKDSILRFRGLEIALDKSEADLQFLRSQINPHFLFNSLNTLYGTALQENAFRAAEGIQKLGDMMRFMLHENHQEKIPMYKEIEYLKNYIDLQQLRTQSSPDILIESEIDGAGCDHMIAPMLLIPFVENAFKHGISLKERSWVKIRLHCDAKGILFEVRNSVHIRKEVDPEKDQSGVGMKNVVNRLRLIYPGRHDFFVNGNDKEFFIQLLIEPGKITTFE
ncbi:histidine kinase [Flavitalea sp. BT771]|uniref:sensor histidine kinase n=1 Tax=Flavitalea sp. BT771 TaxID=3063329 RepID=UPI0026E47C3E|nr:histidine kinase [Flavitalea sp. BT771]MDO6430488.1 histidine kinase [Flavitalea sp. BT771]MDV6219372.1 histidine kinase [Flavitalea sp. BT771]